MDVLPYNLTIRDPAVPLSGVLLVLTSAVVFGAPPVLGVPVFIVAALVSLRALQAVLTLRFVRREDLAGQLRARTGVYLTGVVGVLCCVTLLLTASVPA